MKDSALLARALELIPGGGQTDTKTVDQRVVGVQPSFFVRAQGVYAQDPQGIWWLDCQMGLAAYVLGYNDAAVNKNVIEQLKNGSLFSLASPLELEITEMLLGIFPEFDMARFGKNGSDVTSAAIRIARRFTGRDHVIGCGYHGFQDWSMALRAGITGIPLPVRELTHGQEEVNLSHVISTLEAYPRRYAAVIVDTGGYEIPDKALLKQVREMCREQGTVFIMDEIVSGFRVSLRGTMGYLSIVPDMICLGKAVANGFPLSVLMGTRNLLALAPETGMSSTFGGDCIALAAAKATLEQLKDGMINAAIDAQGGALLTAISESIRRYGLEEVVHIVGYPALFDLAPVKTDVRKKKIMRYLMNALAKEMIFWQGSFVMCRDFGSKERDIAATAVDNALAELASLLGQGIFEEAIQSIDRRESQFLEALKDAGI
jgi:glutamate-1-semialdehyde aminotransferase